VKSLSKAGQARHGLVGLGVVRRGMAWFGGAWRATVRHGKAGQARNG